MSIPKPLTIAASAGIVVAAAATCFNEYLDGITVLLYTSGIMSRDALLATVDIRVPRAATLLALLLAGVLFMAWSGRARRNLDGIPGAVPAYTPGWTIGAWFIPLGNLIMPARVIADIATHSTPDDVAQRRLKRLVWVWWGCYVGHLAGSYAFTAAVLARSDLTLYGAIELAVATIYAAAAVFAILLMVAVGQAQAATLSEAGGVPALPNAAHFPSFTVDDAAAAAAAPTSSAATAWPSGLSSALGAGDWTEAGIAAERQARAAEQTLRPAQPPR